MQYTNLRGFLSRSLGRDCAACSDCGQCSETPRKRMRETHRWSSSVTSQPRPNEGTFSRTHVWRPSLWRLERTSRERLECAGRQNGGRRGDDHRRRFRRAPRRSPPRAPNNARLVSLSLSLSREREKFLRSPLRPPSRPDASLSWRELSVRRKNNRFHFVFVRFRMKTKTKKAETSDFRFAASKARELGGSAGVPLSPELRGKHLSPLSRVARTCIQATLSRARARLERRYNWRKTGPGALAAASVVAAAVGAGHLAELDASPLYGADLAAVQERLSSSAVQPRPSLVLGRRPLSLCDAKEEETLSLFVSLSLSLSRREFCVRDDDAALSLSLSREREGEARRARDATRRKSGTCRLLFPRDDAQVTADAFARRRRRRRRGRVCRVESRRGAAEKVVSSVESDSR